MSTPHRELDDRSNAYRPFTSRGLARIRTWQCRVDACCSCIACKYSVCRVMSIRQESPSLDERRRRHRGASGRVPQGENPRDEVRIHHSSPHRIARGRRGRHASHDVRRRRRQRVEHHVPALRRRGVSPGRRTARTRCARERPGDAGVARIGRARGGDDGLRDDGRTALHRARSRAPRHHRAAGDRRRMRAVPAAPRHRRGCAVRRVARRRVSRVVHARRRSRHAVARRRCRCARADQRQAWPRSASRPAHVRLDVASESRGAQPRERDRERARHRRVGVFRHRGRRRHRVVAAALSRHGAAHAAVEHALPRAAADDAAEQLHS